MCLLNRGDEVLVMADVNSSMAASGRMNSGTSSGVHRLSASRPARPRIGQILVHSGIIPPSSLDTALHVAKESQQQVGRVLVNLGFVSERDLQSGLLVQTLLDKGVLSEPSAIQAVRQASARCIDVTKVLDEMGERTEEGQESEGLGGLLVASGYITEATFEEAQSKSRDSGILLGRTLLIMQSITVDTLDLSLTILSMVRDNHLSKREAVSVLAEVRRKRIMLDDACRNLRIMPRRSTNARLGELLALSRIITEAEKAAAVERGLMEKKRLGQILIDSGVLEYSTLEVALQLQLFVERQVITAAQGAELLAFFHSTRRPIHELATKMMAFDDTYTLGLKVVELLKQSGTVSNKDIQTAKVQFANFGMPACKALLASGRVSVETYSACVECINLVDSNQITQPQAVMAIDIRERMQCSLGTALAQLGLAPAADPSATTAEMQQFQKPAEDDGSIKNWMSYDEFWHLVTLIAIVAAANIIAFTLIPIPEWRTTICYGAFLFLALGLIKIGSSWTSAKEKRISDRQFSLTSAKQTKVRLRKTLH
jgi:hypothetical protein